MHRMSFTPLACVSLMVCHTAAHAQGAPQASTWTLALQAEQDGQLERALRLYERAYIEDRQPRAIYRRILIYERMGRPAEGLQILEQNRALLTRDDSLTDLPVLEQRLKKRALPPTTDPHAHTATPPDRTLSWVMLGAGATATIAGGALWLGASQDAAQLRCASNGRATASCAGVEPLTVPDQADFDARRASIRTREIGAYALVGLGLGALGWSTWSLLSDSTPAKTTPQTTLRALPIPGQPSVSVEVRF